ncbi:aryl-alcohol dehydrogenase-like predicted oxidoreductase [Sphingomonas sp. BE270]|jgi:aryl-alcohol dehydrogenase-like predicted oxidoreductase|uniref:aldo/keto reductase n=1 Tax=unclassified Sphingomonas TaxID=196159 RepID=UPI00053E64BB|nr:MULTISPECIES: aldo/keto reductase [unclassified Sphingomonas]MDR6847626.1 aryl-alcohol dehydrogenase-like predicted oxidoreductase [Sphingomonas sp. BE137]MDR7257658.1 aryl-alcohol dehydrogenase-like predicted oxidoreductase [Sphingomonas sp. BE270]RUN75740.1 aldo/keto reductase [Sphingomonas sp. TF3]
MTTLRRLGATELHIAPLILGGNVFGWTADQDTSFAVLDAFVAGGGTMIDTADVYSAWVPGHKGGESESVIGAWLKASGKREQVQIATKVGMLPGDGGEKLAPARIAAACDASLQRLGVETIDLYFAHQDDDAVAQEDALAAFAKLIDAGKVRALGASNFHAARLKSANDAATAHGLPHYHVLQPEYNLVSRHKFEGQLQDYCVEHNIGVVPYYGLASGYLTGKYRSAADFGKSVRGGRMQAFMDGTGPAVLDAMDAIAEETGASLAQIALAWLAAQPGVTAPIASATSVAQVEELIGAMDLTLSTDQIDRLTNAGV